MKIKRKKMDFIKRFKANQEIDRCRKMSREELYTVLRAYWEGKVTKYTKYKNNY